MAVPATGFPQARTITQLVRTLLGDDAVGPGFPFSPLSLVTSVASGQPVCTATFQQPPGLIPGDQLFIAGFSPTTLNSGNTVLSVQSINGNTVSWVNTAASAGTASIIGTIQGYGTGNKYSDYVIMPFLNSAYRGLQRALRATGSTEFKYGNAWITVPGISATDPTTQVQVDFTGISITSESDNPPTFIVKPVDTLPDDLLIPLRLFEMKSQSGDTPAEIVNLTEEGGLVARPQGLFLNQWEWADDAINFIGATQTQDVKIRYQRLLPALSDGTSQILVLNSEDYHAYATAAAIAKSRGGKNTVEWDTVAEDCKDKLVSAFVRPQQSQSRRMRRFSSRRGWPNQGIIY